MSLWDRTHDLAMENELRKAHRNAQEAARAHGRWMLALGFALGFYVALVAF